MWITNFALGNHLANPAEVRIEATIETDLKSYPSLFHCFQRSVNLCQVVIDGLLTEDMFAGLRCLDDYLGMRVGGGTYRNGVNGRVGENRLIVIHSDRDMQTDSQLLSLWMT